MTSYPLLLTGGRCLLALFIVIVMVVVSRPGGNDDREQQPASIAMHQRAWPLLEQCRRALAAEKAVTWRRPS
ncbi:MAG: DUF1840 family protein [Betaproteobacteria bacterium]|nr:DUF1840 family protein [Betaproteobacteria bacterium]